eukprot:1736401-Karenia_brevis.AAC.1
MVDTKSMTPEPFGEKKDQPTWRLWSKRIKSYVNQFHQGAIKYALEQAQLEPSVISRDRLGEFGLDD